MIAFSALFTLLPIEAVAVIPAVTAAIDIAADFTVFPFKPNIAFTMPSAININDIHITAIITPAKEVGVFTNISIAFFTNTIYIMQ